VVLPGYSQPDEDEDILLAALSSSTSSQFLPDSATQLQIFRGKELIAPSIDVGTSSTQLTLKDAKNFAWSRGIGVELSPLQTRSSRKKKEASSTLQTAPIIPALDGKALRTMKAMACSK